MIAQEVSIAKSGICSEINDAVEGLCQIVRQAAVDGTAIHKVEQRIWDTILNVGHLALQQFLDLQGTGDLGEELTLPDGRQVKRLDATHIRGYISIFGYFEIERVVYGQGEKKKIDFAPLDNRLSLPESKFSHLLQDWDQMASTEQPYKQVSGLLERILGFEQHVDSLERMSRSMTGDAESFCWSREAPPAEEEGELLIETADGKGVPIRRPADVPVIHDHEHKSGPKPDRKKMATLGSVYSVNRFVRTPEEVVDALFRKPGEERPDWDRPQPCHRHVYASLTHEDSDGETLDGAAAVFGWIADEIETRDPLGVKEKVCIMDGQESLWNMKDCFQEDVPMTEVLDLLHVTPRLWKLAHIFCPGDMAKAEQFVRVRVLRILEGEVSSVVRGVRQTASRRKLPKAQRGKVERICAYFEKRKDQMRYDDYLSRGYPIASGVIEGACRHVVKDRLERTGMSWTIDGARAMLLLRSICTTGGWDEYIEYRVEKENERLYPHRAIIEQVEWSIVA